ncbi:MAG TPA: hypothetical protein VF369_02240 [candidate division Zixibacteria bacterium]
MIERVPPPQAGGFFPNLTRRKKMKRKRTVHPTKVKHHYRKGARGSKRSTTWVDPTLPLHKISKRGKTKSNSREGLKRSCWWFG